MQAQQVKKGLIQKQEAVLRPVLSFVGSFDLAISI